MQVENVQDTGSHYQTNVKGVIKEKQSTDTILMKTQQTISVRTSCSCVVGVTWKLTEGWTR